MLSGYVQIFVVVAVVLPSFQIKAAMKCLLCVCVFIVGVAGASMSTELCVFLDHCIEKVSQILLFQLSCSGCGFSQDMGQNGAVGMKKVKKLLTEVVCFLKGIENLTFWSRRSKLCVF